MNTKVMTFNLTNYSIWALMYVHMMLPWISEVLPFLLRSELYPLERIVKGTGILTSTLKAWAGKNLYSKRIVCEEKICTVIGLCVEKKKCTVIGLYVEEKNYPMSVDILKGEVKMVWWLWTILRHTDHHRKKSPV